MYKRHILALFLVLLLALGALAIFLNYENGSLTIDAPPQTHYNVQVILKAKTNPPDFWRVVEQGINVAAEEFGVDCEITAPPLENDIDAQIELVRLATLKKPDAIILAAGDYDRLKPVCQAATDAGILLVTLDSDVNLEQRRCFVGSDNYEMGRKLAALLNQTIGAGEKFGVMGHVASTTTAQGRKDGLLENAAEGTAKLAAIDYCDASEKLAKERTIKMLTEHPDIKCLVGLNESTSLGVVNAVQELGLQGKIPVLACDSSERQIPFMEDGTIQAFVIQNPFSMGYLSMQNTVRLLQGDSSVPQVINTDSVIIKKDDLYRQENQKLMFPFTDNGPASSAGSEPPAYPYP